MSCKAAETFDLKGSLRVFQLLDDGAVAEPPLYWHDHKIGSSLLRLDVQMQSLNSADGLGHGDSVLADSLLSNLEIAPGSKSVLLVLHAFGSAAKVYDRLLRTWTIASINRA